MLTQSMLEMLSSVATGCTASVPESIRRTSALHSSVASWERLVSSRVMCIGASIKKDKFFDSFVIPNTNYFFNSNKSQQAATVVIDQ